MAILNDLNDGVDNSTHDTIAGTAENDTVNLHGGNDYFYDIYDSNDVIFDTKKSAIGASGDDVIWAGGGDDVIVSIFDSTTVSQFGYAEGFHGGAGYDILNFVPSEAGVTVDLAQNVAVNAHGARANITGFEVVHGSQYGDFLLGDSLANHFEGWMGNDTIDGRGGDDMLLGGYGNDWINGGEGNDTIYGGDTDPFYNDDDTIYGGEGADLVFGGLGHDQIYGEGGADRLYGGLGNDRMFGGDGSDEMSGSPGDDTVSGGEGDDIIYGDTGNDRLAGDNGRDTVSGGDGNDILYGGAGNDTLRGDQGLDRLYGGTGTDVLSGGLNADTFVFSSLSDSAAARAGADRITDFQRGADRIDVRAIDANALAAGNQAFSFIGGADFSRPGQISSAYDSVRGETILSFNTDGDSAAEMLIRVSGRIGFNGTDFLL